MNIFKTSKLSNVEKEYFKNAFTQFLYDTEVKNFQTSKIRTKLILNFNDDAVYVLTYLDQNGYMISDRKTGISLEKSNKGDNPYFNSFGDKIYYFGVDNYYQVKNNKKIHTYDNSLEISENQGMMLQNGMDNYI